MKCAPYTTHLSFYMDINTSANCPICLRIVAKLSAGKLGSRLMFVESLFIPLFVTWISVIYLLLIAWTISAGIAKRCFLLLMFFTTRDHIWIDSSQENSGEIKPQQTRPDRWQIVRSAWSWCHFLRYCPLNNLSLGTMIPYMCRMWKSEGIRE